jgi:hypothetical protein
MSKPNDTSVSDELVLNYHLQTRIWGSKQCEPIFNVHKQSKTTQRNGAQSEHDET